MRAFKSLKLPLGAYQFMRMLSSDLGEQFTESGDAPRTLVIEVRGVKPDFTNVTTALFLSEEAQRHIIAALTANLEDDDQRARELITVFHPQYGEFVPDTEPQAG